MTAETVILALADRTLTADVLARDGVWCCTKNANGAGYRVTHAPTGRAIAEAVFPTLEAAMPLLRLLGERFPRWEREASLGERVDASIVRAAIDAAGVVP